MCIFRRTPFAPVWMKKYAAPALFLALWAGIAMPQDLAAAQQEANRMHADSLVLGSLVGTWYVVVPDAPDAPGFQAYQTFHEGGTFTETSSLLGRVPEGPAHGAWRQRPDGTYLLTFELFTFDEHGDTNGRVRVRVAIRLVDADHFTAQSTVDVLLPDGTEIPAVATSPFSGERVKIRKP